jgi:hypothetical protein
MDGEAKLGRSLIIYFKSEADGCKQGGKLKLIVLASFYIEPQMYRR